jgi:lysozyme
MALDQSYLDAIKGFEGYSPNASWDYKQYSSGYGTRAQPGDENIPADQRQGVYEQRFQDEVGKAASSVEAFAPNLPPGVRAALTSLTYNAGPGWQQSGLGAAVKAGDFDKAQQIFLQYNKAGGEVNPGLVARRQKEAAWFTGQPQNAPASPAAPANGLLASNAGGLLPSQAQPAAGGLLQGLGSIMQAAPQAASAPMPTQTGNAMQAPPIQFAQRRPINLEPLRNALAQAPFFARG